MAQPLSYLRLYADSSGESHIERIDMAMSTKMFAPPAAPLDVSEPGTASTFTLLRLPVGWQSTWHSSPARQWLFLLAGQFNMEVSDGGSLSAMAGTIVLTEDTTGRGHMSRVIGNTEVLIVSVQIPGLSQ